jgi:exocyst complex component 2
MLDAQLFHYLETWALSSSEPYTTEILSDFQFFQRQVSTWAFKFASGAEASPSSRLARRPISNEFVMRIMKAFLDATYAFLDGLVYLAAEGSPATDAEKIPSVDVSTTGKIQALGLLDTSNAVSYVCFSKSSTFTAEPLRKDTRALLAISNFVYLERGLISSMMTQFEAAANITIETEKTVSRAG